MWMDLENIMLSEMLYGITYMWDLKNNPNESIYKTETDSQTWKINLWLPKGRGKGGEAQIRSMGVTDTNYYT